MAKQYRKVITVMLALLLVFIFTSCNIGKKIAKGASERILGPDVNIDEDGLTIDDDGKKITIGNSKWPKDGLASKLPEYKDGKIISTVNSKEQAAIIVEETSLKYLKNYLKKVKKEGFTEDAYESETEGGGYAYIGYKGDIYVSLTFLADSNTCTIALGYKDK
jgi:hypothetical protein